MLPQYDKNHIPNFTGISDPFDDPKNADLVINTEKLSKEKSVKMLEKFILRNLT